MKLSWWCRNAMCTAVVWSFVLCNNALGIGVWHTGRVTQSPWSEQGYQHIKIDQVKYTIMPGTKCEYIYLVEETAQKAPQDIGGLRAGDKVTVMVEGNRIYQIEKTR